MSNVIELLERMGQDAELRHATNSDLARTFDEAGIAADVREAALSGDRARLEQLVGATQTVCCIVFRSDEDDEEEDAAPAPSLAA